MKIAFPIIVVLAALLFGGAALGSFEGGEATPGTWIIAVMGALWIAPSAVLAWWASVGES